MWKTKLGRCIYTSSSGYKVLQNPLYRWLTLGDSTLHTVINRRKPQRPILPYIPALTLMARHYPKACCLLGLGGGAIPHLLHSLNPKQPLSSVECSSEIIAIAKQFFMVEQLPNLKVIHQKAEHFVRQQSIQASHLLIDIYDANEFPQECTTEDFFYHCKQSLCEEGYLAINLANAKDQWAITQTLKKVFPAYIVIPIPHCMNLVVLASVHPDKNAFINKLKATGAIKGVAWVEGWGFVVR